MGELGINLPPIDRWTTIDPNGNMRLVDPVDHSYHPNRPPSYIQDDPILGEGLNFLADKKDNIRVRLSLGAGNTAEDLGAPGWFEHQMSEVHALGHDLNADSPENAYAYRLIGAMQDEVLVKEEFNHHVSSESTEKGALVVASMVNFVKGSFNEIDQLKERGGLPAEFAGEAEGFTMAAYAVALNAIQWHSIAKLGLAAKEQRQCDFDYDSEWDIWKAFMLEEPVNKDIDRKLLTMGVRVEEKPYRRQEQLWNPDDQKIDTMVRSGII